jgi:hypothetical protein
MVGKPVYKVSLSRSLSNCDIQDSFPFNGFGVIKGMPP